MGEGNVTFPKFLRFGIEGFPIRVRPQLVECEPVAPGFEILGQPRAGKSSKWLLKGTVRSSALTSSYIAKEGYEFAGMTSDEIVMKRSVAK